MTLAARGVDRNRDETLLVSENLPEVQLEQENRQPLLKAVYAWGANKDGELSVAPASSEETTAAVGCLTRPQKVPCLTGK